MSAVPQEEHGDLYPLQGQPACLGFQGLWKRLVQIPGWWTQHRLKKQLGKQGQNKIYFIVCLGK